MGVVRVNEKKPEEHPLRVEIEEVSYIDENGDRVTYRGTKTETWGFFLRFCGQWFIPCKEDQQRLKNLVLNTDRIIIGNKDYDQPIELVMKFEVDDNSWKEIERRKANELS